MRFDINLASQPYQDVQRLLWRWGMITVAAALVTGFLVYAATSALVSWRASKRQISYLQEQIADRDRQKKEVEAFLGRPEYRQTRERSEFLNSLIARKAFSWTEVFTDLEHIVPPRLRVIGIQPSVNEDNELELHLVVASSSHDAAIELVRRLEQSPHFAQAEILSEALQQESQGQVSTWRVDIRAIYIPGFARAQKQAYDRPEPRPEQPAAPANMAPERATEASNARR